MAAVPHDAYPYVARQRIYVGGALAYMPGDPVPADAVENLGLSVAEDLEERPAPAEDTADRPAAVKPRRTRKDQPAAEQPSDEPAEEAGKE
jgi:hypothetical protein